MADFTAGEAKILIVPDASRFLRDLEADLKRRKAEFAVDVTADLSRATADMDRFRAEQERNPVKVRVEADKSGLDQIKQGLGDAGSALGSALKFNLGAAGIGELPALATAITTVAGSLQQLAGAGLAVPGIFAAIGADVGTAKLALMGVGDAFKAVEKASDGSAKNVQAANEALAKLAPQTADFVRQVSGLKPVFESFQKGVSGNFFDGLGASAVRAATTDLPVLQKGLNTIATAMNQNLKQLGITLTSGTTQNFLDRILGNTGDAQSRLSKAIDPLVHAFGTLATAGSDTLPRLADGVGKLADRFDHFITAANSSGKLDQWINDGIEGFKNLGDTLLNIGKIVTDITGAAGGGGGLLNWLDQGSRKLHEFLSSTQGQETLRKFFADGRAELAQLLPILQNLGPIAAGAFQAARDATSVWAPIIKEVSDVLASDPGLIHAIADAFLAWKFTSAITGVSDAVRGISGALGELGPAAEKGASGITSALSKIAIPAWLTYLVYHEGKSIYDNATRDDAQHPGETTPTDPTGSKGDQDRHTGGTVMGVPGGYFPTGHKPPAPDAPYVPTGATSGSLDGPHGPFGGGAAGVPPPPSSGYEIPGKKDLFGNGFAGGGVLPGYSPGVDNMLVPLAGGEGIIRPEAVRAYGSDFIHMLNEGFAGGGVIPDVLSIATGAASGGAAPGPAGGGGLSSFLPGWSNQPMQDLMSGNPFAHAPDNIQPFNIAASFGQALLGGVLGGLGLQNSILSPTNPYRQAIDKSIGYYTTPSTSGTSDGSAAPTVDSTSHHGGTSRPNIPNVAVPTAGTGAERWRPVVREALAKYGPQFGITNTQAWEDAMVRQIATESGGNPNAYNGNDPNGRGGRQVVQGIGQFLRSTFDANNITGGSYTDPQAQIAAMIPYVVRRYGMNASGGPNAIGQGHGYAKGGIVSRGYAEGGVYKPRPPITDIIPMQPRPTPSRPAPSSRPSASRPAASSLPPIVTPPPTAPSEDQSPQPVFRGGPSTGAGVTSAQSHTLPAISTGITSGFAAAGNIAGAAASFGLGGAGGAGGLVSGAFGEFGKVANDVVDVGSALLVGSVPGSFGDPNMPAYGQTLRPAQNVPVTAPVRGGTTNVFHGISDINRLTQQMDLRDAQNQQASMAHRRPR